MTLEDKELLLKDLCARLPYGIKFPYHIDEDSNHRECDCVATMVTISEDTVEFTYDENCVIRDWSCSIKEVKPYLRPMSSMTKEEKKEYFTILTSKDCNFGKWLLSENDCKLIDFYNSHHFDFRGLIPMGLAIEAKEGMYKIE